MGIPVPTIGVAGINLWLDRIKLSDGSLRSRQLMHVFGAEGHSGDWAGAEWCGRSHFSITVGGAIFQYSYDGNFIPTHASKVTPIIGGSPTSETTTSIEGMTYNLQDLFFVFMNTVDITGALNTINQLHLDKNDRLAGSITCKHDMENGTDLVTGISHDKGVGKQMCDGHDHKKGRDFYIGNEETVDQRRVGKTTDTTENVVSSTYSKKPNRHAFNGRDFLIIDTTDGAGYTINFVRPTTPTWKVVWSVSYNPPNYDKLVDASFDGRDWLVYYQDDIS